MSVGIASLGDRRDSALHYPDRLDRWAAVAPKDAGYARHRGPQAGGVVKITLGQFHPRAATAMATPLSGLRTNALNGALASNNAVATAPPCRPDAPVTKIIRLAAIKLAPASSLGVATAFIAPVLAQTSTPCLFGLVLHTETKPDIIKQGNGMHELTALFRARIGIDDSLSQAGPTDA